VRNHQPGWPPHLPALPARGEGAIAACPSWIRARSQRPAVGPSASSTRAVGRGGRGDTTIRAQSRHLGRSPHQRAGDDVPAPAGESGAAGRRGRRSRARRRRERGKADVMWSRQPQPTTQDRKEVQTRTTSLNRARGRCILLTHSEYTSRRTLNLSGCVNQTPLIYDYAKTRGTMAMENRT
jgi:hypothetical protein